MLEQPSGIVEHAVELPRRLSLIDSTAIVIGMMIGGGIFLVPNLIARDLPSAASILMVWIVAGLVSLFGALACAELGAAFPATGGQYVFLREAFGKPIAFLCGWSLFTVVRSAQVAWLSVAFSIYLSYLVPIRPLAARLLSLGTLALFSWINYRGVKLGARVQNGFTAAKVMGIFVIIVSALLLGRGGVHGSPHALPATSFSTFGVALVSCLLCYDGWVQLTFVAGEIQNPKRNVVRALIIGTLVVAAIYLLANLAYLRVLSVSEIAASQQVAADAAARVLGSVGGSLIVVLVLVSMLGTLNGCFLTSPRVYFAQAADGLFFRQFAEVHSKYGTPGFAIIAQAVWSAVLVVTGSYESLIDYALFGAWVFYGLMIASVIVLRRKRPHQARPYRMWGYPVTAGIFLAVTCWFLANLLASRPVPALAGLALMLTGVPAYLLWHRFGESKAFPARTFPGSI
jgi:amino acid transporter